MARSLTSQNGSVNVDENRIHNGIVVKERLNIGRVFILKHHDEFGEELLKLKVVIEISLAFTLWCEEYLKLLVKHNMDEVEHKRCVEASLGLNLISHSQQLVVEYLDVRMHIVL
jgi:hypothetical protein